MRLPDLTERRTDTTPTLSRSERLRNFVNRHAGTFDETCLVQWNPEEDRWEAWFEPHPSATGAPTGESGPPSVR